MKFKKYINQIFIFLILLFLQILFPFIDSPYISSDFFLIFLTYLTLFHERYLIIIIGFSLGLIQDFIGQKDLIGLFAFSKTISAFLLGYLSNYSRIWNKYIKVLFLFFTYMIHFFISSYLMYDRDLESIYISFYESIFHSLSLVAILLIVNRFILIDNKIIK